MKLPSNRLISALKQRIYPVFLVTGDEFLLVEEACEQIFEAAKSSQISERRRWQTDRNFNWQQIQDEVNSLSLFDDSCVLEVSLTSGKLNDSAKEIIIAYCENPPENKILILKANKIDARTLNSKWCKAIEKIGCIVQCWPIPHQQLPAWIRHRLQLEDMSATSEAIQFIAEQVEGNLLAAKQEIQKLKLVYDKKNLQLDDVVSAMSDNARYDVFKLIDCALSGDTKRTLRIIQSLKAENAEPVIILWAFSREIRSLLGIKRCQEQGERMEMVFQKFGVWEKRKVFVSAALKRLSTKVLLKLLGQSSQIDRMIKGVASGDVWSNLVDIGLQLSIAENSLTRIFHNDFL